MEIRSNVIGKLFKIRDLKVFSRILTFVMELLQNCQRARAKKVMIIIGDGHMTIVDNGCGCRPEAVFTFDFSEWDSTTEGFGIGFNSIYAIPGLKSIVVASRRWRGFIETEKLFAGDLSVKMTDIPYEKGFSVTLESEWFNDHMEEIKDEIEKVARYMPFKTYINGYEVERGDILDDFEPDNGFSLTIRHKGYKAKLTPANAWDCKVKVLYDGREIGEVPMVSECLHGVVSIAPGYVTMKEPDRTEIVRDDKYDAFRRQFKEDRKKVFKTFIEENGVEDDRYTDEIAYVLSVKDYDRYLNLDPSLFPVEQSAEEESEASDDAEETASGTTQYAASIAPVRAPEAYTEPDFKATYTIPIRKRRTSRGDGNFRKGIQKLRKKSFWVRANETDVYKEAIAEAKYVGLNVLTAKNRLYEKAFSERGILHISDLSDSMVKTTERKNSALRTKKEELFVSLLSPIVKKYGLPEDCFRIANLEEVTEVFMEGKRCYRRVVKNRPGQIRIYGVTDSRETIYLDRTAMNLKAYNIRLSGGKLGVWECKALMNAMPTVAHELAHFLYHTTDNTVEHYQAIERLSQEIAGLYR